MNNLSEACPYCLSRTCCYALDEVPRKLKSIESALEIAEKALNKIARLSTKSVRNPWDYEVIANKAMAEIKKLKGEA